MATVNPLSGFDPAQFYALGNAGETPASETKTDVDKNDFLKLLVAQLEHQDPLSPMKNEAFIAQLATFSSLEQLIAIKQGIEQLVDSTGKLGEDTTATSQQAQD